MPDAPLVKEALVLRQLDRRPYLAYYVTRAHNRNDFVISFSSLVSEVVAMAEKRALRRFDEALEELIKTAKKDPGLRNTAQRHLFHPSGFFLSPTAQAFLDGNRQEGGSLGWLSTALTVEDRGLS